MIGPIFSPSAKAVADYLGKSSGIPEISIVGQPTENLETANGLAFIHTGFFDAHGYYFGKFLAEKGYKTANVINYDDTPAYALTAGFEKAFVNEGGGTMNEPVYVPVDTVDFSAYLSSMKPADVTVFWIFGNGAVPFVKQYNDYGLTAPLAAPMSNNFSDAQLAELGDIGLGMIACDYYAWTLDNQPNKDFIAAYEKLYPGEKPTPQGYGAWQGVMMYIEALKATGGDTTRPRHQGHVDPDHGLARRQVHDRAVQERLHRHARLLHLGGAEGRRRADLGARQDLSAGAPRHLEDVGKNIGRVGRRPRGATDARKTKSPCRSCGRASFFQEAAGRYLASGMSPRLTSFAVTMPSMVFGAKPLAAMVSVKLASSARPRNEKSPKPSVVAVQVAPSAPLSVRVAPSTISLAAAS